MVKWMPSLLRMRTLRPSRLMLSREQLVCGQPQGAAGEFAGQHAVEIAGLVVELVGLHQRNAQPDQAHVAFFGGIGDAADAAAVHGFPFGAFETQVAAAFFLGVGEVPRVVGAQEYHQQADVRLFF